MSEVKRIRLRRGTAAAWTSANPILANAEPGYETDTRKIKYGDGVLNWNDLTYLDIDIDDLDDSGSLNKFVTQAQLDAIDALGTASTAAIGDFDPAGSAAAAQAAAIAASDSAGSAAAAEAAAAADATAKANAAQAAAEAASATAAQGDKADTALQSVDVPEDITATGTPDGTTVLHGDGTWKVPEGGAVDSVNTQTGDVVLDAADVGAAADDHAHAGVYQPADADLSFVAASGKGAILAATETPFTVAQASKLNSIEPAADRTDAANVTAAGALMDSEVTNLADVKAFDPADFATAAEGALAETADAATKFYGPTPPLSPQVGWRWVEDSTGRLAVWVGNAWAEIPGGGTVNPADYSPTKVATAQAGTTYTVDADDDDSTVILSNAAAVTVTIPTGLAVGYRVLLASVGAGGLSLTTTGNTLLGSSPSVGVAQNEGIYVEVTASDTLLVLGGTA